MNHAGFFTMQAKKWIFLTLNTGCMRLIIPQQTRFFGSEVFNIVPVLKLTRVCGISFFLHVFLFCWLWGLQRQHKSVARLSVAGKPLVMPAFTPFAQKLTLANVSVADGQYPLLREISRLATLETNMISLLSSPAAAELPLTTVHKHHRGRLAT